jgi:RNA polymerase sigma-70 factor (ECF subfamily)
MGGVDNSSSEHDSHGASSALALNHWFTEYRGRLRGLVQLRLSPLLVGRLDPSDVIQETFLEATERFSDYHKNPEMSPYLWLRFLALQQLGIAHRRHLHTHKRAAGKEAAMPNIEVSSVVLADWLVDSGTSPSKSALHRETREQLLVALETMSPQDREILTARHFEQLSNEEAAQALGISTAAASRRYYRALDRLRDILEPELGNGDLLKRE